MDKLLLCQFCCVLLVKVSLVYGYCDSNNLNSEVQKCLFMSPIFSGGLTNVEKVQTFCRSSLNSIVDCMEVPIKECHNHPTQRKLLDLLINMTKLRESLQYLCNNINEFSGRSKCMDSIVSTASFCMSNAMNDLTLHMQSVKKFKDVFDVLCTFFDRLLKCYVEPFKGDCESVGTIFRKVFNGIKYPYCSLPEYEKKARIAEIETSMAVSSSAVMVQNVFLPLLSLFAVAVYNI